MLRLAIDRTGGLRPSTPICSRIINAQLFRWTARFLIAAGYDEAMSVILDLGKPISMISEFRSVQQRIRADARSIFFCDLISEFPFWMKPARRSAHSICKPIRCVSHALAAAIRLSLDRTPLHAYDATAPGTAQEPPIDTVAMIATGHECR